MTTTLGICKVNKDKQQRLHYHIIAAVIYVIQVAIGSKPLKSHNALAV